MKSHLVSVFQTCKSIDKTSIYCETPTVDIDTKLLKESTGTITDKETNIKKSQGTVGDHQLIVRFDFDNSVTNWRLDLYFDPEFANFTDAFRIKVFRRYRETTIIIQVIPNLSFMSYNEYTRKSFYSIFHEFEV